MIGILKKFMQWEGGLLIKTFIVHPAKAYSFSKDLSRYSEFLLVSKCLVNHKHVRVNFISQCVLKTKHMMKSLLDRHVTKSMSYFFIFSLILNC